MAAHSKVFDQRELLEQTNASFTVLRDMLELGGGQRLPADAYYQLDKALDLLLSADIDPNDPVACRVARALGQINEADSKWPSPVRRKAKLVQIAWMSKHGRSFVGSRVITGKTRPGISTMHSEPASIPRRSDPEKLRKILGMPSPPMKPSRKHHKGSSEDRAGGGKTTTSTRAGKADATSSWSPRKLIRSRSLIWTEKQKTSEPRDPMCPGHLGFEVGFWWSNPSAAIKAGVISAAIGITADYEGAYAVIMAAAEEVATTRIWRSVYKTDSTHSRSKAMVRNLRTQDPVRVLRTCKQSIDMRHGLFFDLRPRAGVRYDGLYRVIGYSVNKEIERELWHFEYTLERLSNQPTLEETVQVPTSSQLRHAVQHWNDTEHEDAGWNVKDIVDLVPTPQGSSRRSSKPDSSSVATTPLLLPSPLNFERAPSVGDGYFSIHA